MSTCGTAKGTQDVEKKKRKRAERESFGAWVEMRRRKKKQGGGEAAATR